MQSEGPDLYSIQPRLRCVGSCGVKTIWRRCGIKTQPVHRYAVFELATLLATALAVAVIDVNFDTAYKAVSNSGYTAMTFAQCVAKDVLYCNA